VIFNNINNYIDGYMSTSLTDWLAKVGYSFETSQKSGIGDADLSGFYEYRWNDEFILEASLGLKFPLGSNNEFSKGAYHAKLGNGGHWEVLIGAMGAWQPDNWVNLKLDSTVAFVLSSQEKRSAVFENSTVKTSDRKLQQMLTGSTGSPLLI